MTTLSNIVGVKCPDCNYVLKFRRPTKAGVYRMTCPCCGRVLNVRIPDLSRIRVLPMNANNAED